MHSYRRKQIPDKAHPLVKALWREAITQRANLKDVSKRAGVKQGTVGEWSYRRNPTLLNLEAFGNALGLELVWRRQRDTEGQTTDAEHDAA